MAESNNVIKDFKAPTTLGTDSLYINWKKEIKMLEAFTSVQEEKRTPAIFIKLTGEARKAVFKY